ncbi:MAG TPA: hypothetical protein VLZ03_11875 [Thermodesulfobacteriota bacterium]|nr:hypothetical protein [Thermodesulfobacteriota bacterium]
MNRIIYYPYTYPTVEWLKLAALYWKTVNTLTSKDSPEMPLELRKTSEQLGNILKPIDVGEVISKEVEKEFLSWIDDEKDPSLKAIQRDCSIRFTPTLGGKIPNSEIVSELAGRGLLIEKAYRSTVEVPIWLHRYGLLDEPRNPSSFARDPWRDDPDYKELGRMEEEANNASTEAEYEIGMKKAEEFYRAHLVELVEVPIEKTFLYVDQQVILHYWAICASHYATEQGIDLIADGSNYTRSLFKKAKFLETEIALETIEAYMPKNIEDIDTEKIIDFRNEHEIARVKFQKAIHDLTKDFSQTFSEKEFVYNQKILLDMAKERVEETKKTYRRAKIEICLKAFEFGFAPPAILTFIASALGIGIFAPAGIAASVGLFGTKVFLEHNKVKQTVKDSPWSYVLESSKLK